MTRREPRLAVYRPDLTPRQREVIALIARGRTNPQIAEELGISLEGVKHHVSEILDRLDVQTREEAADAWRAMHTPRARVARAFGALSAKPALLATAGAAAVVVAVAAGLLFFAARSSPEPAAPGQPPAYTTAPASPEDFLQRVDTALRSVGEVAHVRTTVRDRTGGQAVRLYEAEAWFDAKSDAVRLHWVKDPSWTVDLADERIELRTGGNLYYVDDSSSPPVKMYWLSEMTDCYEGEPELRVTPLLCAFSPGGSGTGAVPELEGLVDFEGRQLQSLLVRVPASTGGGAMRLLVEPDTYLPVVLDWLPPPGVNAADPARYEVEAVSLASVGKGFFDPEAFGWVAPEELDERALNEVARQHPVWWLGAEYRDPQGRVYTISEVDNRGGGGPGHSLTIAYRGNGGHVRLDLWAPGTWEQFVERMGTAFQWAKCADERVVALPEGELTILRGFELPDRPPGEGVVVREGETPPPATEPAPPDIFPATCPDRPYDRFMAVIRYPGVVATINAPYGWGPQRGDPFGVFDTEEALEAVARALHLRN